MSDAPFVARVSRAKVWGQMALMLACALLVIAVTIMIGLSMNPSSIGDWGVLLFGVGCAALLAYASFWVGRALRLQGEMVAVDADGIRMATCYIGTLPWSAIARAEMLNGRLNLWLVEGAPLPPGKQLAHILRSNRAMKRPDLPVTLWLADRRTDELVEAVRSRAPQLFA